MTEEQMLARRALQEAMDRRDNGGPPPELLRPGVPTATVESPESAGSSELPAQVRDGEHDRPLPAAVLPESPTAGVPATVEPVTVEGATAEGEDEGEGEHRLGVPFPRVAA